MNVKKVIVFFSIFVILLLSIVPSFANSSLPEFPSNTKEYWLLLQRSDGSTYLCSSSSPFLYYMDGSQNMLWSVDRLCYKLVGSGWEFVHSVIAPPSSISFTGVIRSNHDVYYRDDSRLIFFFANENPPPGGEQDGLRDILEEYFGWFSPSAWLADIGDMFLGSMEFLVEPIENLGRNVGEWFSDVVSSIDNIVSYLNPFSDTFFLKIAFVPSPGYFEQFISDLKEIYDEKFAFVHQIGYIFGRLFGAVLNESSEPPSFSITLPGGKWGSGSLKIIDFSVFSEYRFFIRNFIRVLLWIPFLIKLYKKLPSIIYI